MGGRKWTTASRLRQALAHGTQYGTKYETASIAGQREKRNLASSCLDVICGGSSISKTMLLSDLSPVSSSTKQQKAALLKIVADVFKELDDNNEDASPIELNNAKRAVLRVLVKAEKKATHAWCTEELGLKVSKAMYTEVNKGVMKISFSSSRALGLEGLSKKWAFFRRETRFS